MCCSIVFFPLLAIIPYNLLLNINYNILFVLLFILLLSLSFTLSDDDEGLTTKIYIYTFNNSVPKVQRRVFKIIIQIQILNLIKTNK